MKAVVLSRGSGRPRLAAAATEPAPAADAGDEIWIAALQRLLDRCGIQAGDVARMATAVGGPRVVLTTFEMPRLTPRELRRALPWEARKHLPDDDRVCDYTLLEDAPDVAVHRVLLASIPRLDFERHLSLLRGAGLTPEHVEPAALSLARACRRLRGDVPATACLLLDIGHRGTTLVLGDERSEFFARFLEVGLAAQAPAVVAAGDFDADAGTGAGPGPGDAAVPQLLADASSGGGEHFDELVLETRRSLAFFSSQRAAPPVARVILAGGGAMSERLCAAVGDALGVPLIPFGYKGNRAVPVVEGTHAVAYGLAIRMVS
jgi:type IV pilus assembly protein PilM